jgi:hypothetical protein
VSLTARRVLPPPAPWLKDSLWRKAQAVPSLDLRFADNKSLVDAVTGQNLITFTRASSATYIDSTGKLQTAATDAPRFDHNPLTGESLGLLVEEARTNLVLQSEEFDNAVWFLTSATLNANAIAAPNGTLTAAQLTEAATTANHEVAQAFISPVANAIYTLSCYLKASTSTTCGIRFSTGLNGVSIICSVDLTAQTAAVTTGTGTAIIANVGSGWFRVSLTATASGTPSTTYVNIFRSLGTAGSIANSIYFWGSQLEQGAFATSYIPTTTAAATRAADVASITGGAFSSWYRQDEGTFYTENRIGGFQTNNYPNAFSANDSTGNNIIQNYRLDYAIRYTYDVVTGGVAQTGFNQSPTIAAGAVAKMATAVATNNGILVVNGIEQGADTSLTMPTGINRLQIPGGGDMTIRRLTYFPSRLPNTTLQRITQ